MSANSAFASLLGFPDIDSVLKVNATEFYVDPTDREKWKLELGILGKLCHYEVRWKKVDGAVIWVKNSTYISTHSDGSVLYFGVVENATPYYQIKDLTNLYLGRLTDNDERFLALLDTLPVCIYRKILNGSYIYANPAFLKDHGMTKEQLYGITDTDLHSPDLVAIYQKSDLHVINNRTAIEITEEHEDSNKRRTKVNVIKAPFFRGSSSEIAGIHGVYWNDKDQALTLKALHSTGVEVADSKSIIDSTYGISFEHDLQGRLTHLNYAGERLLGYSVEELRFTPIHTLIPSRYKSIHNAEPLINKSRNHDETLDPYEIEIRARNGQLIPLEVISRKKINDRGETIGIEVYCKDISERRRNELERLHEIHHRVKNNLFVIYAFLGDEIIGITDGPAQRAIEACRERIMTIATIHQLLYSERDTQQLDLRKYLDALSKDVISSYRSPSSNLRVECRVTVTSLEHVDLDLATPLGLIINELLSNSLKHGYQLNRDKPRWANLQVRIEILSSREIELLVIDNGDGISSNIDIFTTGSLGMKLVRGLVEKQLSGSLSYHSNKNGTTFIILIPTK